MDVIFVSFCKLMIVFTSNEAEEIIISVLKLLGKNSVVLTFVVSELLNRSAALCSIFMN